MEGATSRRPSSAPSRLDKIPPQSSLKSWQTRAVTDLRDHSGGETVDERKNDIATIIALAALAICTTAFAHEGFGHGGACLLSGGHIALLNNAYFHCSTQSPFIDIGGPAGNLIVGLVAFLLQSLIPRTRPALRFYAFCVSAFSLYWEAGYIIFAAVKNHGDYMSAWSQGVGPATVTIRIAAAAIGVVGYFLITRMTAMRARAIANPEGWTFRIAWLTAVVAQGSAAALYAPDRIGAVHDAALSAVAAFPLLFLSARPQGSEPAAMLIARNFRIIGLGVIGFAVFALTMGRGVY